ncbi:MAG: phenylalanine--tRNA ligase beta subunit-related protein [Caldilineaceae bacterium]
MDDTMLMIADTAGDIAIAGVMGRLESEVSEATRNILLESATFEGISNRRTAQKLRMSSEASYRFARGIPATLNSLAAQAAAELMRKYAGGAWSPAWWTPIRCRKCCRWSTPRPATCSGCWG